MAKSDSVFTTRFIDHDCTGVLAHPDASTTKVDFGESRRKLGLQGITVWNNTSRNATYITVTCLNGPDSKRHGTDTYIKKEGADGLIIGEGGWASYTPLTPKPLPTGAIKMSSSCGNEVSFSASENDLRDTGYAGGLREFVTRLGLPSSLKTSVMDSISQAQARIPTKS